MTQQDVDTKDNGMAEGNITHDQLHDRILQSRPFAGLPEATMERVLHQGHIRQFGDGRILVHQGAWPQNLYVVLEGQLKTSLINDEGSELTLRMLGPGNTCMAAILFMGNPSPVTVQTYGDTTLWVLPGTLAKKLILKDPKFAANMLKIAVARYSKSIDHIHTIALKTPLQRIGHYLLGEHISRGANDLTFELPYKKSIIASHLGMTPETLSRSFARIKKLGIRIDGQKVCLKDAFALCHFCDLNAGETCPIADKENCPMCRI